MRTSSAVVVGYVAGRFDLRVILPIAALVLVTLLTVAVVLRWTAAQQNEIALRNELRLVDTALAARLTTDADMLFDYAFWDEAFDKVHLARDPTWAADNIGAWAHDRLGVDATFVIAPDGTAWFAMGEGAEQTRDAAAWLGPAAWHLVTEVRRRVPDRPLAGFARVQGRPASVAAATISKHTVTLRLVPGTASVIVQVRFLDAAELAELARTYLLPDLALVERAEPAGAAHRRLLAADGAEVGELVWRTSRPGDDLLRTVQPVLFLAMCGLALLTWVILRGARDAAAAIAFSERQAALDMLTGLPNRRVLDDRLSALLGQTPAPPGVALLYLDLDGFKPVNDRYGHGAGDELLIGVAHRLVALAPGPDTLVARVGGDEFAMLTGPGLCPDDAAALARRLIAAVAASFTIDGRPIRVGMSVGVALSEASSNDPRTFKRAADAALYAAKRAGLSTFRIAPAGGAADKVAEADALAAAQPA